MPHFGPRGKLTPEQIERRYKPRVCRCGNRFVGYGGRILCDKCKEAQRQRPEALQKRTAYVAFKKAMRNGLISPQPCIRCAERGGQQRGKSHAHHEDYSKPLEVQWLCSWHHISRHQEIARASGKYFNTTISP